MPKRLILLISYIIGTCLASFSADYRFDHYSTADGLPNNRIRNIIQDKAGYLWITTSIGISRYDGNSFEHFPDINNDSVSLKAFRLRHIFEDREGGIWSINQSGNCYWINPQNQNIYNLQEKKLLPKEQAVNTYYISSTGDIWLTLDHCLSRLYYNKNGDLEAQYFDEDILGEDRINFIIEDKNQKLWIGTNYGLVSLTFDANNKSKYTIKSFFTNQKIALISALAYEGNIYFGLNKDFMLIYNIEKESFSRVFEPSDDIEGGITTITSNNTDHLLLGTTKGNFIYYNTKTGEYISKDIPNKGNSAIQYVYADSYGIFWIITSRRGIYQFTPKDIKISYFSLDKENRTFLGESDKQQFLEDSNQDVWVGINGGGLFKYEREHKRFKQYKHDPKNIGSLTSDVILSLYEDRSKNLWVGTSYGGLNKISLKQDKLDRIKPEENPSTVFDNYLRSVTSDIKDNMWVGSKAGKIYIYNKQKKKIATIPDDLHASKKFPLANVYALYFDNDNNLWIGTKGYGLFVIKSATDHIHNLGSSEVEIVHFQANENNNSISSNNIYCIQQDIHGQYWLGSFKAGLSLLTDPFTNPTFRSYSNINTTPSTISGAEIRDIMFDRKNNLWIASSAGVSVLKSDYLLADNKAFRQISSTDELTKGIQEEVVYQIKQLRNGDILLAILDGGIQRLKYENFLDEHFKWDQPFEGLSHTSIYSIEEDAEGNIWMGSDGGLLCYNAKDKIIEKYKVNSTNTPLIFSENCSCTKFSQEIALGSTNGLIILHPDSMSRDTTQYPLLFSKLEINGSIITSKTSDILNTPIAKQSRIDLRHDQNNVSLYFSTLDYENSEAIQYKSYLKGYENDWSKPSSNNSVYYRKLPPGEYTLCVQGTNSRGVWIKDQAELDIIIHPLFWKSLKGRAIIFCIVLLIISTITTLIYRQIKIKHSIRIDKEITEKRMEYYTNLSHEFKTPLSLIISPIEEILYSHKSSSLVQQKGMQIKKNAIYLNRLINQILDFRKIREGRMKLEVSEIDIIELLREIYLIFLPLSKRMGIHFDYVFNEETHFGYADSRHIEKVVYNLLSNAFRFSTEGKKVELIANVDKSNNEVFLNVIDQGPGISEDEIDKIFQRFYDSKHSSGIGLFYTKELVNLHKGDISVSNNTKGGANFAVSIPLSRKTYTDTETVEKKSGKAFTLKSISDIEVIVGQTNINNESHRHTAEYYETVLVVEDNEEMRNYIKSCLSNKYKVIEAEDGAVGLELAINKQPTLIISDISMPTMDGYDMVRNLKSNFDTSHIPIFLVTAESSEEQKIFALECGADDFITKPFNVSLLMAKIEHIINQRKKLKERFERDNSLQEEGISKGENKVDFLSQVQELVVSNMSNEQMNVDSLVDKMGYSRTLFYKKMRSYSGYAPNEYIRIVRMKEAAKLLTSTDKTVNEISSLVGISDSNYFSKIFKKHFGESPSFYKSNN